MLLENRCTTTNAFMLLSTWTKLFKGRRVHSFGYFLAFALIFLVLVNLSRFSTFTRSSSNKGKVPTVIHRFNTKNISRQNLYVRFRNVSYLTTFCESIDTISCLNYLHQNKSDYFEPMSFDELSVFKFHYCTTTRKMLFHTFWNDASRLDDDILRLHIDSFLYTQNRKCSCLIVWLVPPIDLKLQQLHNSFYQGQVTFRSLFDIEDELHQIGIYIDSSWSTLFRRLLSNRRASLGDVSRFIILHKYGGLYVDVDTLFLRDLQPFFAYEFAYKWSYVDGFNTAVLRLFPQSNVSSIIIDRGKKTQSAWTFYPLKLHQYGLPRNFYRFPCAFFDALWFPIDTKEEKTQKQWKLSPRGTYGFKDPFRKSSEISRRGRNVFDGAFTFHSHSSSGLSYFERDSFFHRWRVFLDAELFDQHSSSLENAQDMNALG